MQRINVFRDEAGELYDVPESDREAFLAEQPAVRPVQTYRDQAGELFDVPEEDAAAFMAEKPDAEQSSTVRTDDGEVFDVPDSGRAEFLKTYRTAPEFEADRTAARATVQAQGTQPSKLRDAGEIAGAFVQGAGRGLADAGVTLASGVVAVPQLAVGLADLAAAPVTLPMGQGGIIGKTVGKVADFKTTREAIESLTSEEQQVVNSEVQDARGFVPTVKALAQHPSVVAHGLLSSVPAMAAGGAVGQSLAAAGMGAGLAGAIGEGVVTAAQMQEDVRARQASGLTTAKQTGAAVAAGAATAAFSGLANKLAGSTIGKRIGLGVDDIDTLLAGGARTATQKNLAQRLVAGAVQEGLLEEFPQSASEKMFGNIAEGKPLMDGVLEAGIQGGVTGALMGMAGNAGGGNGGTSNIQRPTPNIEPGTEMGPPAAPGVAETALVPPPVPAAPPVAPFAPEMVQGVPLLDQAPLPPSVFAPTVQARPGPTVKAAETMRINVQDQAAWDRQVQALREAKRNPPPREVAVREPGQESDNAKRKRISLKAFIAADGEQVIHPLLEHALTFGSLTSAPTGRYKGEYDSWRALVKDNPEMGMMLSRKGGMPIDIQAAEFGMEPEAYVAAIKKEWDEFKAWRANNGMTDAQLQDAYEADRAEANLTAPANRAPDELKHGDIVKTQDGQWRRVDRSETDVVLLRDGTDIPLPADGAPVDLAAHVPEGQPGIDEARQAYREQERQIWAESERERIAAEAGAPDPDGTKPVRDGTKPVLSLEATTTTELDAEAQARAAEAQRREVAVRAAAPIEGNAGDQTMVIPGMEGEVDSDLFDAADQQARRALGMEAPAGPAGGEVSGEPSAVNGGGTGTIAVRVADVDTPAQGQLNQAREGKKRAWEAVKDLQARIKVEPIGGNRSGLRIELIQARQAHDEWLRMEQAALKAIELRANELGQTTIRPTQNNREATAVPSPAQPGPGGAAADMEAAAAARGREGAITLPGGVPRGMRAGLRRIGTLFMPNRGVGDTTYDLYNEMNRKLSAANMAGREFRNRIRGVVNGLQDVHGRDNVMAALREVQEGDLTPEAFSGRFGLARGNDVERFLGVMLRDTEAASQRILKWSGRSKEARANVAEQTFYQTRAYLVHALGEGYDPPESARRAASLEFKAGMADAVQRLAVGASAVRGRRGGLDVVSWLETGDETFLKHASRTRADAARTLRGKYLALRGMIDELAVRGDHVTARLNAEAATRAADGFVEFYLKRSADRGTGGGGNAAGSVETGHLRARFLEGALRNLYGEITDPAVRQQITTEVQARMIAEMTFFERVFAESEGAVWAYQPDLEKGIVERLGDAKAQADRMKYGDMAGRYVTAEFKGLIDAARNKGAVHETMKAIYFGPMGFQRMAKLLAPKTISRNYITALMGFGLQSGDVFLPGYWRDFGEGHRLAVDYARGRPDAIARIRELTELGVFAAGGTSATADMQAALGGAGKRMQKLGKGVTEAYSFIDFPTKFAAFQARQRAGMSRAQAVQHVQDLYQNRERTPAIVGKVSRIGLRDYFSYSYDSTRIAVNGLRHAVAEAKAGRVLPMFGWITARSIFALTSVKATQMASEAVGKLYAEIAKLIRPDDDDEKKGDKPGIAPLASAQLAQMRKLVMPYDANAPLLSWRETQGGRLKHVGYTVAGGQTAFPIDDWIVGLLQSPQHGEGFINAILGLITNSEGMYIDLWARTISGSGFDGKRTPTGKGLWHVMPGKEEPERAQIIGDAITGWIADMAPTYPAKMFMQLMQRERDQDAGIENVGIFARRQRSTAEIVLAEHRLVRSYTLNRTEMNAAVRNAIRPQLEGLERTREIVSGAERQRIEQGAVRPRNEAAAQSAQEKRAGYVREVADTLKAAQAVAPEWWDVMSINLVLKESGMPQTEIYQVLNTVVDAPTDTRYFPSPDVSPYRTRIYQDFTR